MTLTKNRETAVAKVESGKAYSLEEASKLVKEMTFTKFDATIDIALRLGVDPKNADQMVRGTVSLPNGSGKQVRLLALVTPDKEQEAKDAGADLVGLDEFVEKIDKGWTDIDVIVAVPAVMGKIGRLGKVLGPRNLMPNPKSGTVSEDIGKAITEIKKGKISFKVDKSGIVHAAIGKTSFTDEQIYQNALELIQTINKMKPAAVKGTYMMSIYLSSTMSPSLLIDTKQILGKNE